MHHNYGGISESHACKDCVWPISLDAEVYTTCPGDRTVARKSSIGGPYVCAGGFTFVQGGFDIEI